jgi:opacity protein-like surface antigen
MRRSAVVMIAAFHAPMARGVAAMLAALCIAAVFAPVLAADFPSKAVVAPNYTMGWSGVYVQGFGFYGVNAGSPSGAISTVDKNGVVTGTTTVDGLGAGANGPGFGGALGYNYQIGHGGLVIGVRAEESWANFKQSGQLGNGALSFSDATHQLGAVNGIIGIPVTADGRALLYAGAGFAWMGVGPNFTLNGSPAQQLQAAASQTSTGFDVLGGFEYKLDRNWGLFGETAWYSINNKSLSAALPNGGGELITGNVPYSVIISKLGVAYHF